MNSRIKLIIFTILFFMFNISCREYEIDYYKKNKLKLQALANTFLSNPKLDTVSILCVDENKSNLKEVELMNELDIECISKDTTLGILNFNLKRDRQILQHTGLIFLFDKKKSPPVSYPNAGVYIKKLSEEWFLRIDGFD